MLPLQTKPAHLNTGTPISPASTTGEGGAINNKTLLIMFECVKIVGLLNVETLCSYRLLPGITTGELVLESSHLGLNETQVEWLLQLNPDGVKKVQEVLQAIQEKKPAILNAFRKGENRNKEIELISMSDDWLGPRIIARAGSFYIKEEGFFGDEKLLFSYVNVIEQFKKNLRGLDLSKLNLPVVNFRWADLTGVNFDGSNLIGANLEGAAQENMQVTGANLTGVTGFKLLLTTVIDERTKFKHCGEVTFNQEQLTGENLRSILNVIRKIEENQAQYDRCVAAPFLISMINTLKVPPFASNDRSILLDFLTETETTYFSFYLSILSVDEVRVYMHDVLIPSRIADANTSDLCVRPNEKKYLDLYACCFKGKKAKAFIDNNRGFIIQLLCMQTETTFLLNLFYKKHAQQIFDICFQEKVCPGISGAINTSAENGSPFAFELLPIELRNSIYEKGLSIKSKINFSLTSKFNHQSLDPFFKERLKERTEVLALMRMCSTFIELDGNRHAKDFGLPEEGECTLQELYEKWPQFKKDKLVPETEAGLEFLLDDAKVTGPNAIQRIKNGDSTIVQEVERRLALQKEKGKDFNWDKFSVIEKFRLDGSLSDEDFLNMTEQGKVNLKNYHIEELINFCKLPIEQGLRLTKEEVSRLERPAIKMLIMNDHLTINECLKLTLEELNFLSERFVADEIHDEIRTVKETLELLKCFPFMLKAEFKAHISKQKLEIKPALFLIALRDKYKSGGWPALAPLIKPNSAMLGTNQ